MTLSTASVYPEGCVAAFSMAAQLGFDGVEVMVWNDPVSQDVSAVARLSEHYGVPVRSIHAPTLLLTQQVWGTEPWPKIDRAREMAERLGASTVVIHPPFRWQRDYARDFVGGLASRQQDTAVALAVENMFLWRARGRVMEAYAPGWDPATEDYAHLTLDLSHSATAGLDGMEVLRDMGSRLSHLHLADGTGGPKDEHLVPGRGSQPCAQVLEVLAGATFRGDVVCEINTRRAPDRGQREADLLASLHFARTHLAAGVVA